MKHCGRQANLKQRSCSYTNFPHSPSSCHTQPLIQYNQVKPSQSEKERGPQMRVNYCSKEVTQTQTPE